MNYSGIMLCLAPRKKSAGYIISLTLRSTSTHYRTEKCFLRLRRLIGTIDFQIRNSGSSAFTFCGNSELMSRSLSEQATLKNSIFDFNSSEPRYEKYFHDWQYSDCYDRMPHQ